MRGMRRGVQRDNYILLMRKAPLAVLVALGGVGDADTRGGGELYARAIIPLSPLPHVPPQSCHLMYSLCKCGEKKDHDKGDDEQ